MIIHKAGFHKIKISFIKQGLIKMNKRNITQYSPPAVPSFSRLQIGIVVRKLIRFKILEACSNHRHYHYALCTDQL